ncbi:MAG: hypothetical protein ACR2IS_01190 [Nitrososphaeraceae archaeon]
MSTNSQSVNPVQDLLDRIIEIQRRLEDLGPNVRSNRVQGQYEHARTRVADARSAIMALVTASERESKSG